ncbi:hypothetical protein AAT19DRAFT_15539 [Rhodotorula toruloides]|uniref:Uncharacterized protein n=1 Tax=Rhodotorula toruloides TaxID=5286 RepID=A0A2T0A7H4_RHOTO|nr:hypothetical protein AAT19DRAFT_15539 [Rhodotorula toruloides]
MRLIASRVRVEGRVFASKGYGQRVSRVLKAVEALERLELVGVDDLRPKHLVGQGTLTHLTLLNSFFRPNSLPSPPSLAPFLSSLTHLTLANLGLPPPSTQLTDMLLLCAPTLHHLALSSLRDVDAREFRRALRVLVTQGPRLHTLMLGFLTDEQISALCQPLDDRSSSLPTPPASPTLSGSSPSPNARAALSLLPSLISLTFTLPLPTLPILLALPPSLKRLTIRPPYARSSAPGNIFGTSRTEGLALLRRPSPSSEQDTSCAPTPLAATPSTNLRRPSISLTLLEEEETILVALEEMLGREGVAEGLESVRWECRALRSAEGRVGEALERRRARGRRERSAVVGDV